MCSLLSNLHSKAITVTDWCNIRPTIKDNIIREILQGIYVLAIHANNYTKVVVRRAEEFGLQERHGWEYTLIFHTSHHMDQCYFCELQILWEPMWKHPKSRYGASYLSEMVVVIRRLHGNMGVTLHRDLEVALLRIQRPSIKDARNDLLINPTSNHYGIAIPIFQSVHVILILCPHAFLTLKMNVVLTLEILKLIEKIKRVKFFLV